MKISTEIGSAAKLVGEKKAVELVGKAGFDAWDLSLFDIARYDRVNGCFFDTGHHYTTPECIKYVKELRNIAEAYGMVCNQSHAPFPTRVMSDDILKRAIECTAVAGGEICVIHPDNNKSAEENAETYFRLLPFAKSCGVKIATENMWNWYGNDETSSPAACSLAEDFVKHIATVNDPYFVACLDIGHAEMRGSGDGAAKAIRALGSRLQALHVHDNDKIHDSHQLPFTMNIDFEEITRALAEIGYSGYITLEVDRYLADFPIDEIGDKIKIMADTARRIAKMIR